MCGFRMWRITPPRWLSSGQGKERYHRWSSQACMHSSVQVEVVSDVYITLRLADLTLLPVVPSGRCVHSHIRLPRGRACVPGPSARIAKMLTVCSLCPLSAQGRQMACRSCLGASLVGVPSMPQVSFERIVEDRRGYALWSWRSSRASVHPMLLWRRWPLRRR